MRILVLGRSLPSEVDSIGQFEFDQASALVDEGNDVVYGYCDCRSIRFNNTLGWTNEFKEGVHCIGCSFPLGHRLRGIYKCFKTYGLRAIISRLSDSGWVPNIVYAHFPLLTLTKDFVELLGKLSIPLVCLEHWSKVQSKEIGRANSELLSIVVRNSAVFCCVSEDLRDSICEITGVGEHELRVIPNMVDERIFHPDGYGTKTTDVFRFLACGRLVAMKRFDLIVEAFAAIAQTEDVRLVIAGDGPMRKVLARRVRELGIDDAVELIGWKSREEMAGLMRDSDCYVSASGLETFGVPFAEAWMCGIPCVGANNNPLRRSFVEENGKVFCNGSAQSLRQSMQQVMLIARGGGYSSADISDWARRLYSRKTILGRLCDEFEAAIREVEYRDTSELV